MLDYPLSQNLLNAKKMFVGGGVLIVCLVFSDFWALLGWVGGGVGGWGGGTVLCRG